MLFIEYLHKVTYAQDFGEDCSSESESDVESGEECTSDSEMEDANDASNEEEWTSSAETKSEASEEDVDVEASVEALEKLIPFNLDDFEKVNFELAVNNLKSGTLLAVNCSWAHTYQI